MGILNFGILIIKNNIRQFVFHIVAVGFSVCFMFTNLLLMFNSSFYSSGNGIPTTYLITIFGAIFLMNYINSYFIKSRAKEMGVIAIGGTSVYEISRILLFENIFIFFFGTLVGLAFTGIFLNIIYPIVFSYVGANNVDIFSSSSLLVIFSLVSVLFFQIIFCNLGFFIRKKVKDIISSNKPFVSGVLNEYRNLHLLFLLVYFLPSIALFFPVSIVDRGMYICFFSMFSAYGAYGIMRYILPHFIKIIKDKFFINNKVMIIALSNVLATISKCWIQVLCVIVLNSITLVFYPFYDNNSEMEFFAIFSFLVTLIIVMISLSYQIISDSFNKIGSYKQLIKIGFYKSDIRKINYTEVILSFF